jgi:hypothetical protein
VATGKILAKAHCLRAAQQGVAAAEAYWVALICGERTAAYGRARERAKRAQSGRGPRCPSERSEHKEGGARDDPASTKRAGPKMPQRAKRAQRGREPRCLSFVSSHSRSVGAQDAPASLTLIRSLALGRYDLHSLVSSGASGCAKHTFLAAVLFCVAVEASSLTDRESKEAAPLPDSALDARLKREPKEELVRRCKEVAQPPLRVATFACARVIHRAMQVRRERRKRANEASATKKYPSAAEAGKISGCRGETPRTPPCGQRAAPLSDGQPQTFRSPNPPPTPPPPQEGEHAFVTSKLGTSLALATQHLDETDLKISAALAPHAHLLPIQLGSYNLLDLLRIPETPPAWALSQRCSQCEEKFGLFVRRHHCRGASPGRDPPPPNPPSLTRVQELRRLRLWRPLVAPGDRAARRPVAGALLPRLPRIPRLPHLASWTARWTARWTVLALLPGRQAARLRLLLRGHHALRQQRLPHVRARHIKMRDLVTRNPRSFI